MTMWLKQSTEVTIKLGPFLDETDGKTAETALTITQADVRLSKNGGNIAQKNHSGSATHDELGYYDVTIDTTDTGTLGRLLMAVHESGALPVWKEFMVVPANVWDSMFGADKLQVHAAEITNDLITAAALAADAVSEIADGVLDEPLSGHTTAGTLGERMQIIRNATAQAGAAGTITLDASANATDDFYNDTIIAIVGGTGVGQSRIISDYVGSTKVATVNGNWVTNPDATSAFIILPFGSIPGASGDWSASEKEGFRYRLGIDGTQTAPTNTPTLPVRLDATGKTHVNTEVKDVLETDTHAEPASVPAATSSLKDKINWLFTLARNKVLQTASQQTLRNDGDSADIATAAVSDNGTQFTRDEWT